MTGNDNKSSNSWGFGEDSTITLVPFNDAQECPLVSTTDTRAVTLSLGREPDKKYGSNVPTCCVLFGKNKPRSYPSLDCTWDMIGRRRPQEVTLGTCPSTVYLRHVALSCRHYLGEGSYFELAAFDSHTSQTRQDCTLSRTTTFGHSGCLYWYSCRMAKINKPMFPSHPIGSSNENAWMTAWNFPRPCDFHSNRCTVSQVCLQR